MEVIIVSIENQPLFFDDHAKQEEQSNWTTSFLNLHKRHAAELTLIAAYSLIFIFGAAGNIWVAGVVGRALIGARGGGGGGHRRALIGRTTGNNRRHVDAPMPVRIYIFSLCCCDLLVLIFLPLLLLDLLNNAWIIRSRLVCRLYLFSEGMNKFALPWLLTALSRYCYENIRRSMDQHNSCQTERRNQVTAVVERDTTSTVSHRTSQSIKRPSNQNRDISNALLVILACALAVILSMTPVYMYGDIYLVIARGQLPELNQTRILASTTKCAFQPPDQILSAFTIYTFAIGYAIPAFLFTYFYTSILLIIRRRRSISINADLTSTRNDRLQRRYWTVAKTTIGLIGFYLSCWTPYYSILLYLYFYNRALSEGNEKNAENEQDDKDINGAVSSTIILSYLVHTLPYINCSGYPILYTVLNKSIRARFVKRAKNYSAIRRKRQPRPLSAVQCHLNKSPSVEDLTPSEIRRVSHGEGAAILAT